MFKSESLPVFSIRTLVSDFEFPASFRPEVRCIYFDGVGARKTEVPAIDSDGRHFGLGGLTADRNSME
jgi:hypothetical protein